MNKKKIITVVLLVGVIHFVLTSVIEYYIAVQIGTQMGQVVIGGLEAVTDKSESKEEVTNIVDNMKGKSEEIKAKWTIEELIISMPAGPLMNPLLRDIRRNQFNKLITKEINRDQFVTQGLITDYTARLLNSILLGLLVYIALRIINRKITRGST
jgi:hypothetical protein